MLYNIINHQVPNDNLVKYQATVVKLNSKQERE